MGLNDPDSIIAGGRQAERARQAQVASELRSGLAGLPKPQNEYEIRVPEADEDGDEDMADAVEEDAADVAARRKAKQKAREEAELRKRSQVGNVIALAVATNSRVAVTSTVLRFVYTSQQGNDGVQASSFPKWAHGYTL